MAENGRAGIILDRTGNYIVRLLKEGKSMRVCGGWGGGGPQDHIAYGHSKGEGVEKCLLCQTQSPHSKNFVPTHKV